MNADELRRLSEAATPGPWHHGLNEGWEYRYGSHIWRGSATEDPTDPEYDAQQFIAYTGRGVYTAEDAAFIVALVNLYRSNQLQVIERDRLARALDWIGAPELDYHVSEMNAGNGSNILAGVIIDALHTLALRSDSTTGDERG